MKCIFWHHLVMHAPWNIRLLYFAMQWQIHVSLYKKSLVTRVCSGHESIPV